MSNGKKAEIVFIEELLYIKHPGIKDFTIKCFEKFTSDYFWDFTASSSQKHHPKVSNKKHGIILHTKLCVWWGRKLADNFDVKDLDVIVSALLLHDLQKFGKMLDKDNKPTLAEYWGTHGPMLAVQIESLYNNVTINDGIRGDINAIITCIALHMGRFTNEKLSLPWIKEYVDDGTPYVGTEEKCIEIVQMADYCASRQCDTKMEELDKWEFPEV
jgi:hypothetical protein